VARCERTTLTFLQNLELMEAMVAPEVCPMDTAAFVSSHTS